MYGDFVIHDRISRQRWPLARGIDGSKLSFAQNEALTPLAFAPLRPCLTCLKALQAWRPCEPAGLEAGRPGGPAGLDACAPEGWEALRPCKPRSPAGLEALLFFRVDQKVVSSLFPNFQFFFAYNTSFFKIHTGQINHPIKFLFMPKFVEMSKLP